MNFAELFIKRPVGTTLLALGIAIFGVLAFRFLPVAPLPEIEFPSIAVFASLPGADPETMATSVATPLEREIGLISGVTQLTSVSKQGSMRIVVQFDLSRDVNGAARDIQAAIIAARKNLPTTLPAQPNYRIVNPADAPIMVIGLTSKIYSRGQMYDYASSVLQQKMSQVDGVGQVIVGGSSLPGVRVELNPDALNQYQIGLEAVAGAIKTTNVNQPKGQIQNDAHAWEIVSNDQMFKARSYDPVIVAYRNNSPVHLRDVGEVVDSVEDIRNAGIADGRPAVLLIVYKMPGSNIIETVDRIYKALDDIKSTVPAAVDLTVVMDRTETIRSSLFHVEITLVLAILLVVAVIYVFLANPRAALIPSVVMPITILGTFAIMYLCGFSLNNLSLMALTISTGFIVDDAVVVLENIERYIEKGMAPFKAALLGAQEVTFTVLSMSISLIAVFIPILLMGGIVGRLFREFALTLSFAIMVSLVISLTVTPVMSSTLLKGLKEKKVSFLFSISDRLRHLYRKTLKIALRHPKAMIALTGATIALTVILFILVPKGFFPLADNGRIMCSIQTQQDMSFQELEKKFKAFAEIILADPEVAHVAGFAGGAYAVGNSGSIFVSLKPYEQRKNSVFQIMDKLRPKLNEITGAKLFMQATQDLVIGARSGNAQYQYTITAFELDDVNKWTPLIQEQIEKIPGITDLSSDLQNHGLEIFLNYDRAAIARFGTSVQNVDQILNYAFGQSQVSTIYTAMNQYHVVMEVAPQYWQDPSILKKLFLINKRGERVPLSSIASFSPKSHSLWVSHQGQFPASTITFNLLPGYSLGDIVNSINQTVAKMNIPAGTLQTSFQGTAAAFQSSLASEPYLIMTALLVIYIVLGILYESLVHPLTILSTLPSAGVGAFLAILLFRMDLSVIALIGVLLLIGIVKKNAIMMIDFAVNIQREQHKSPVAAIYRACLLRFRPIMMTTMAAIFGALPLVVSGGVGAELRQPMGVSIIGGLLVSQLLTLYTTPVMYLVMERLSNRMKDIWRTHISHKPWVTEGSRT